MDTKTIQLKNQTVNVVKCDKCGKEMVNLDAGQLAQGDLVTLKQAGVLISNPATTDNVCVQCEYTPTFGHRLANWFGSISSDSDTSEDDSSDDDDSSFFHSSGGFLGGSSFGGFGGSSFGGFGGGGFSGGGASGSF